MGIIKNCFIFCFSTVSLIAFDFSVVPAVGIGQAHMKFNFDNDPVKVNHDYLFLDLGANINIEKKYYISIATTMPMGVETYNIDYTPHIDTPGVNLNIDYEFARHDYLLILGHRINSNVSIFTGYRRSVITNDFVIYEDASGNKTKHANNKESTVEDGLMLGSQLTYPIYNWGLIGAKVAIAMMHASYSIDSKFLYPDETGNTIEVFGKATGLTYGIGWYGKLDFISNDFLYVLALDGYKFNYELSDADKEKYSLDNMNTEFLSYRATLMYRF